MMDEKEELKQELQEELQWVHYRQNMLDIIEKKLLQMKQLAAKAQQDQFSEEELKEINAKLNNLARQVKAIDEESKKIEDGKILE